MAKAEYDFDWVCLEPGYSFTDILDLLRVPHYTNSHRKNMPKPKGYTVKEYPVPDGDEEEPLVDVQLLVVWDLDVYGKEGPTNEQIAKAWAEIDGSPHRLGGD